jgi:hypothetical protein
LLEVFFHLRLKFRHLFSQLRLEFHHDVFYVFLSNLDSKFASKISALESKMDSKFDKIDLKFEILGYPSDAAFGHGLEVACFGIHRLFEVIRLFFEVIRLFFEVIQLYFCRSHICLKHVDLIDSPALRRRGVTRVVRRILRRRRDVTIIM